MTAPAMTSGKVVACALLILWAGGFPFHRVAGAWAAASESGGFRNLDPRGAEALIKAHAPAGDLVVLDVRTPEEFRAERIRDAVLLDYRSKTFREDAGKLDRGKPYLVYCRSGNRSAGAVQVMKELGFRNVYHMVGGILRWKDERLPTVR